MQTWQWLWVLLLACCPLLLLQLVTVPKESTSSYLQLLYGVNLYSPKELFRGHRLYELVQLWKITKWDQHDIIILGEALLCKSRSNDEKVVIVWNMYIKAIKMGKVVM
ncbi:hypothetical protein EDD18DRAFT_1114544 [Armillaria luteobubalina]|uniref:Uncharacterized protein n=1 Tax=Armillaria luteobubalina TaxID=153913 RepID=A0AA39UCZ3_9AGAR|nr:hypothetical protein EDD18DRAFT_1114544 [Armillaria luteobubalina]